MFSIGMSVGGCQRHRLPHRILQTIMFILFGQKHLDRIVGKCVSHYNTVRSHTERSRLPPAHAVPNKVPKLDRDQIMVRLYVGGLVKSFERKAA